MIQKLTIAFVLLLSFPVTSCVKVSKSSSNTSSVSAYGLLQKQGVTSYNYGTHTLGGYALKSSTINLDNYLNKYVTIQGHKINGYPQNGGPDYIEVDQVSI